MIVVISPAKTLDFETPATTKTFTEPKFLDQAEALVGEMRHYDPASLSQLMGISDKLAALNVARFAEWSRPFTQDNAKQAVLAFQGDVYTGLEADTFKAADLKFAQKTLRILSGLYGVLRPLDLMQPYRLEMGTKVDTSAGKGLYRYWGSEIAESLNADFGREKTPVLVNLASNEYFKAVDKKTLNARIITPIFKDEKNGKYKVVSFYAKKARGMMAAYIVRNRIKEVEEMKAFDTAGYHYSKADSTDSDWVFLRSESDAS